MNSTNTSRTNTTNLPYSTPSPPSGSTAGSVVGAVVSVIFWLLCCAVLCSVMKKKKKRYAFFGAASSSSSSSSSSSATSSQTSALNNVINVVPPSGGHGSYAGPSLGDTRTVIQQELENDRLRRQIAEMHAYAAHAERHRSGSGGEKGSRRHSRSGSTGQRSSNVHHPAVYSSMPMGNGGAANQAQYAMPFIGQPPGYSAPPPGVPVYYK